MSTARDCVVDINMVAIYVMVKGEPGIKRARLYKNKHGEEIFDRMVGAGLISVDPGTRACTLTDDGERFGLFLREIIDRMGDTQMVEDYLTGLIDWYQGKIDSNRVRNRGPA